MLPPGQRAESESLGGRPGRDHSLQLSNGTLGIFESKAYRHPTIKIGTSPNAVYETCKRK